MWDINLCKDLSDCVSQIDACDCKFPSCHNHWAVTFSLTPLPSWTRPFPTLDEVLSSAASRHLYRSTNGRSFFYIRASIRAAQLTGGPLLIRTSLTQIGSTNLLLLVLDKCASTALGRPMLGSFRRRIGNSILRTFLTLIFYQKIEANHSKKSSLHKTK